MSGGHYKRLSGGFGLDAGQLDRLMKNEAVQECMSRPFVIDYKFDCPYIASYSKDWSKGGTVYIDRHLPEIINLQQDGRVTEVNARPTLITHEHTEKSLLDALHYTYDQAHRVATAAERRLFVQLYGPGLWPVYQEKMDQYAKHDEHEKLTKVPSNLDLTPYLAPPVDRKLLAHLEKFVSPEKSTKTEAQYNAEGGRPSRHCGPDKGWPSGYCSMYREENRCTAVAGYIAHRGICKFYEKV